MYAAQSTIVLIYETDDYGKEAADSQTYSCLLSLLLQFLFCPDFAVQKRGELKPITKSCTWPLHSYAAVSKARFPPLDGVFRVEVGDIRVQLKNFVLVVADGVLDLVPAMLKCA